MFHCHGYVGMQLGLLPFIYCKELIFNFIKATNDLIILFSSFNILKKDSLPHVGQPNESFSNKFDLVLCRNIFQLTATPHEVQ
jgi:hypothetical protein